LVESTQLRNGLDGLPLSFEEFRQNMARTAWKGLSWITSEALLGVSLPMAGDRDRCEGDAAEYFQSVWLQNSNSYASEVDNDPKT